MKRYRCPSCGETYNGKRCRKCNYEHFTEEIAHGTHTHTGEPLVIDAPRRKPIPRKNPFGCETKTRKKRPFLGFLAILLFINCLLPLVYSVGQKLETIENTYFQPQPEPLPIPENAMVLYQDQDIQVLAQWPQDPASLQDFPIYVRNDSRRDICVSARDILVNGYLMEYTALWCEASAGTPGMGKFYLDEQDKANAGILAVEEISFRLDIYDSESYDTVALTPVITLTAELPDGTTSMLEPKGTPIFDRDGLRAAYLGFSYPVSAYSSDSFEDGTLQFLFTNETGLDLDILLTDACVNASPTELEGWCILPSGAKAVVSVYVYPLEEQGFTQPEQLQELTFAIEVWDSSTYEELFTDSLTVTDPAQPARK